MAILIVRIWLLTAGLQDAARNWSPFAHKATFGELGIGSTKTGDFLGLKPSIFVGEPCDPYLNIIKYLQSQWLHKKKASDGFSVWLEDKNCACKLDFELDFRRFPFQRRAFWAQTPTSKDLIPQIACRVTIHPKITCWAFFPFVGWLTDTQMFCAWI